MKRRLVKKGTALFIVVFLSTALVAETALTIAHRRNLDVIRQTYEDNAQAFTDNLARLFGQAFAIGAQTVNTVFGQRWYKHFRNVVGYYREEFDEDTRSQIIKNLVTLSYSFSYAKDVLVITPELDTIICTNGWFTLNKYREIYGTVLLSEVDSSDGSFVVAAASDDYAVITMDDYSNRRAKTVVAVLLDNAAFSRAFMASMDDTVAYVNAVLEGQTLLFAGDETSAALYRQSYYKSPRFYLQIGFTPPDTRAERQVFLLSSCVLMLVVVLLAVLISHQAMKPVKRIVWETGGQAADFNHPYDYVRAYIEKIKASETDLNRKIHDKSAEIDRFMARARKDIVFGMLTNRDFRFDEDVSLALPWLSDGMVMCLLMGLDDSKSKAALVQTVSEEEVRHHVTVHNDGMLTTLLWLSPELSQQESREYSLYLRRKWQTKGGSICMVSHLLHDPAHASYYYMQLLRDMRSGLLEMSALSEETRTTIAEYAYSGCWESLLSLVRQLRADYAPSDVLNPLRQALGQDNTMQPGDLCEDVGWEEAFQEMEHLAQTNAATDTDAVVDTQGYLNYIDEHYADVNLSIAHLADYFCRHRTLISKDIKAASGMTFTDYLRNRRMDAALAAIDNGNRNMMVVAREIGYASYASFKRAFQQRVGCTPMEYKERMREADSLDI